MSRQTVPNYDIGTDTARLNLLTNGGFEVWQRGAGFSTSVYTADRWFANFNGTDTLAVNKSGTVDVASAASARCDYVKGTGTTIQHLFQTFKTGEQSGFLGKTISFSIRVQCTTANAVRASVIVYSPSGATTYSNYHSGSGLWETLSLSVSVPAATTEVDLGISFAASCSAWLDNAMLVVGAVAADYAPLHPADDLARCLRYYEKAYPDMTGYMSAGNNIFISTSWHVQKAVTPTLTVVGTFTLSNCTGLTVGSRGSVGMDDFYTLALASATGIAGFFPPGNNVYVSGEANP